MANVLNHHSGQVLRSTTSVNLPIPFTPTSGSRLVVFIDCSSTFTMGSGWSKHLTGVGALERAVAIKTSDGAETSVPVTLAVARSVAYTVIELRSGGTLSVGSGISDASNQSGLPSNSDNTLMFSVSTTGLNSTPVGSSTWAGTPALTEASDRLVPAQGGDNDDAVYQTVAFQEGEVTSMTASRAWATGPSGLNTPVAGWLLGYWNTPGGGGEPENTAPTANAGTDQTVQVNTQVTLNGSSSSDSDGTIASYTWTQTAGTTVTLSGTGASRTFTPTVAGTYTFQLTVTDDDGATGSDSVTVTVNSAPVTPTTVAEENALTGMAPSQWFQGLSGLGLPAFARSTYYLPGQTAQFSVDCTTPFTIQIFRFGHYAGNGAREVATPVAATPATQPAPVAIAGGNGAVTCAGWSTNASWAVPATAIPGWYMAMFRRDSDSQHGYALFQVSDKNSKRPIVIVASDATWHAAYNGFGGNNVYGASTAIGSSTDRAFCSTYDKPVYTKDYVPQTHFFNTTYPYLKWSERMGINAAHTTIEQIKDDPTILDGRSLVIWTGHNEYIPQQVMDKTKSLLAAGQNMMNLAGNDFFWRVRFTDGAFSSSTNGRVMWCKKDTLAGPSTGPDATPSHTAGAAFTTQADWTGTWQDTRWSLREPSEDFFGDQFIANGVRSDEVQVPASMKALPPWRNCAGVQALSTGQTYTFADGTLGMEWDRPMTSNTNVEQVLFSTSIVDLTNNASDANGQNYNTTVTDARHAFAMVRKGNSYIANFNSDQWPWALDALHLRGSAAADANAMQMMLNVIYDLGGTAHSASVTSASLTVPTPVTSISSAYGFTAPDPSPTLPGVYYSDGTTWTAL